MADMLHTVQPDHFIDSQSSASSQFINIKTLCWNRMPLRVKRKKDDSLGETERIVREKKRDAPQESVTIAPDQNEHHFW